MKAIRSKMKVGEKYFMSRDGAVYPIKVIPHPWTGISLVYENLKRRDGSVMAIVSPGVYFKQRKEAVNHAAAYIEKEIERLQNSATELRKE